MSGGWIGAFAAFSRPHEPDFNAAYAAAVNQGDAIVTLRDWVRVRVRDRFDDGLLLLALPDDLAQRRRVGPGRYEFPSECWPKAQEATSRYKIRFSVMPWAVCRIELRHRRVLDALRAARRPTPASPPRSAAA